MPTYETVFAVPVSLEGDEKQQSIKSVEDIISGAGGSVKSSQDMGEMKMAYKVKGHDRAYYHLIKFECPPAGIQELKKHYNINSNYIRNIVVRDEE
ncbi:MAG: 30S ribosomal protein S6 [Elusimicrobia bacterium]|nr:30S ribosomal protein S6 [Elusimicrobiota bacterium]